ncbi:pre-16S rRNA-processing nuclease YqgF [Candidatus Amesbacteria bacterium]|nr:pre-16S rRNA-processing nuclease YqgF [Candidatus Amesbacteria bacterium]
MNVLGLDYGQKHIGVALATGPLAEPLTTIPTQNALQLIKELIKKHHIKAIIIGMHDASMHDTLMQLGLPVYEVDETLSTQDAVKSLFHTTQKRRQTKEHSVAATLILQFWLDSENK